jgi:hypothetical protein
VKAKRKQKEEERERENRNTPVLGVSSFDDVGRTLRNSIHGCLGVCANDIWLFV